MDATVPLKFYGNLICPYVQRARTALNELEVPYSYEEVDPLRNEQFSSWFKEINPLSKVPALVLPDKRIICQSLVIVEYVDEVYGNKGSKCLFPSDPVAKANIRQWVSYLDASVLPKSFPINMAILEKNKDQVNSVLKQFQEALIFLIVNSGFLNRMADAKAKGVDENIYFWGPQFTYFDIACLPFFQNLEILLKTYYPDLNIFQSYTEENKDAIAAFGRYYRFASQRSSFQHSNFQVSSVPALENSKVLEELQMDSLEKWNYETFYQKFIELRLMAAAEANLGKK